MSSRNGNGLAHDHADLDALIDDADDGPVVVDKTPPTRPVDPALEALMARGKASCEWRDEARARVHRLVRRLLRAGGGSEDDAIAVLEGEVQRLHDKRERRKKREKSGATP